MRGLLAAALSLLINSLHSPQAAASSRSLGWTADGLVDLDMQQHLAAVGVGQRSRAGRQSSLSAAWPTLHGHCHSPSTAVAAAAPGLQFVFVSTDDADDANHCSAAGACGRLYPNVLSRAFTSSATTATTNILAVGVNGRNANSSLVGWLSQAGLSASAVTYALDSTQIAAAATANFTGFRIIYIGQSDALAKYREQLRSYINQHGGSLVVLTQQGLAQPFAFFPIPLRFVAQDFVDVSTTPDIAHLSPDSNSDNLDHNAWHGYFTGPQDWSGIYRVLVYKAWKNDSSTGPHGPGPGCPVANGPSQDCLATVLCNQHTFLSAEICGNGIDDDGNGLVDKDDEACWRCGDGNIDPIEQSAAMDSLNSGPPPQPPLTPPSPSMLTLASPNPPLPTASAGLVPTAPPSSNAIRVVATLVVEGLVRNQPDVAILFNGAVLGFQVRVLGAG
ncbi:hypothetical protein V8C86DRAFT_2530731 [Haematococcus lacustris]